MVQSSEVVSITASASASAAASAATKKQPAALKFHEGATLPDHAPDWAVAASQRIIAVQNNKKKPTANNNNNDNGLDVTPPPGARNVLLHSCCGPCSGAMVQAMADCPAIERVTVFFYNPNIHPRKEYMIRKEENKGFCERLGIEFVDCDYDVTNWYQRMKGMEYDPERGRRCTECFDMRMERCALYAHEHGMDTIATTNATSRWKDRKQVDDSGVRAAARYATTVQYWTHTNWQSDEMTLRKYEISAGERFYKQEYCGCSYSLRDSNEWRRANSIPPIQIGGETAGLGERYFTDPLIDAQEESQEVVDEFFQQANMIAEAGTDIAERKKKLTVYKDRRKAEATDGITSGINNW
jgi:predicted adenine nucleotide alpha hydrolase (AANH) superfamily ATPase